MRLYIIDAASSEKLYIITHQRAYCILLSFIMQTALHLGESFVKCRTKYMHELNVKEW